MMPSAYESVFAAPVVNNQHIILGILNQTWSLSVKHETEYTASKQAGAILGTNSENRLCMCSIKVKFSLSCSKFCRCI